MENPWKMSDPCREAKEHRGTGNTGEEAIMEVILQVQSVPCGKNDPGESFPNEWPIKSWAKQSGCYKPLSFEVVCHVNRNCFLKVWCCFKKILRICGTGFGTEWWGLKKPMDAGLKDSEKSVIKDWRKCSLYYVIQLLYYQLFH